MSVTKEYQIKEAASKIHGLVFSGNDWMNDKRRDEIAAEVNKLYMLSISLVGDIDQLSKMVEELAGRNLFLNSSKCEHCIFKIKK